MNLRAIAFVLLLARALSGCSFMGLDEFDLQPCNVPGAKRSPCDELNAKLPADQCEEYVCDDSGFGCVLEPRDRDDDGYADPVVCRNRDDLGALDCDDGNRRRNAGFDEICDGIDNDCDDWIDENTLPEAGPASIFDSVEDSLVHMSASAADDGPLYFALTYRGSVSRQPDLLPLVGDPPETVPAYEAGTVCTVANENGFQCDFGMVEIAAAAPNTVFGAGINYGGCGSGQLRVGGVRDRGRPVLGSSLAIDIVPQTICTASTDCSGAARPVVAALPELDSAPAQALIVWNAPLGAPKCPRYSASSDNSDPAAVAALGVLLYGGERLVPTADHSELLGDGATGGPAAVIAWPGPGADGGYFVAFTTGAGIDLRFVPRLGEATSLLREGLVDGTLTAPSTSHATLALDGSARDAPRGLGLAYRTERSGRQAVAFAPLRFDPGAEPALSASSAPIEFETTEPITSGPALAYARDGFAESADARKTGGWLLTWIEGAPGGLQRLMAARIPQAGLGSFVAETHRRGPPFELARGELTWPFTYSKRSEGEGDELHYGFIEKNEIRLGNLTCNPLK